MSIQIPPQLPEHMIRSADAVVIPGSSAIIDLTSLYSYTRSQLVVAPQSWPPQDLQRQKALGDKESASPQDSTVVMPVFPMLSQANKESN